MIFVDAHCDTITRIMEEKGGLYENGCHVDLKRMKKYDGFIQFFAAFIDPFYKHSGALKRAVQIIDEFYKQLDSNKDSIMLCRNYNEITEAIERKKVGAVLSIEGGEALQGDLSALRIFYRMGVRSICLTWNNRNEIGDGVMDEITGGGLSVFGREVVKEMNSLGMLIDLSHISERGFWDVMELTGSPVIVSHSNARAICDNRRNLNDKQIKAVKENGGVIGINLYPLFLNGSKDASLKDVISHIDHMSGIIGVDNIGIGADFDGITCTPVDIPGVEKIFMLADELLKKNYSQHSVEKIAGGNFLRVIKEVFKST